MPPVRRRMPTTRPALRPNGGPTMPELRKDPIVGRWVIIATSGPSGPHDFKGEAQPPGRAGALPVLRGPGGQDAARDPRLPRPRHAGPTARAGASASCPTSSPPCKIEGNLNKRGDGIYDMMNGIGAHEVIIECPRHEISMADADRGEHPRGALGLPRPAGRPEEGPAAGLRHALQERRRGRRRQPGAHPLAADRHARSCRSPSGRR